MRKDIDIPKVDDIAIAVVKEEGKDIEWNVYLLNLKGEKITNVIVASKGYGVKDGKEVKTSVLRHHWDEMEPKSYVKIEPIIKKLFGLSNEYWISFYIGRTIFDKKYVFLPETIIEKNMTDIPLLNKKGVMIK